LGAEVSDREQDEEGKFHQPRLMREANRVWRTAAEARTKPRIDPQMPRGERMGKAATACGVRRQRKLT